jgi:drug/metabolite transporter (DMT)-like permease
MAVMGLFNALAHSLVIAAFARAPASVLAPFAYSQMIWATGLGYLLFTALPDAPTWAGAAIIIASGLYTLHRERIVARQRTMQPVTAATEPLPS